jgi:hypothetical protein
VRGLAPLERILKPPLSDDLFDWCVPRISSDNRNDDERP